MVRHPSSETPFPAGSRAGTVSVTGGAGMAWAGMGAGGGIETTRPPPPPIACIP